MKCVAQRVSRASVTVEDQLIAKISDGFLVYVGIAREDTPENVAKMANRLAGLRIMPDKQGRMNRALAQTKGSILLVSQFTLLANTTARRLSFTDAMEAESAKKLFDAFTEELKRYDIPIKTGVFGAKMSITSTNEGPVTILLDMQE